MEVVNHQAGLEVDTGRFHAPQSQQQYSHQHTISKSDELPGKRARPSWLVPALLGGLLAALVVGGAVGGGLGAALAKSQNRGSSANTTLSAQPSDCSVSPIATTADGLLVNYAPPKTSEIYNVTMDCASLAASAQFSYLNDKYAVECGKDYPVGTYLNGNTNFYLVDMAALRAYSFQDCIDACSATTRRTFNQVPSARCLSVTFRPEISGTESNCWLKNATQVVGQGVASVVFHSARFII